MSDADFAARYPQMVQARNSFQSQVGNILGTPGTPAIAAGSYDPGQMANVRAVMQQYGVPSYIDDHQAVSIYNDYIKGGVLKGATPVTPREAQAATPGTPGQTATSMAAGNQLMKSGQNVIGQGNSAVNAGMGYLPQAQSVINTGKGFFPTANNIIGQGQALAGRAGGIINQGQQFAGQAQNFLNPASDLASRVSTIGQPDITLGQNLISGNQAIDPVVQQELMRAGLSSAASALGGAAGLGGTAGQAAVGRNLGVGASNWINQQRQQGMALQQTGMGLETGTAGAAGTLAGAATGIEGTGAGMINAGSGVAGAGSGLIGAGTGVGGLGTGIINAGTGIGNLGATLMNTGANLYGQGTGMTSAGQGVINNAGQLANQTYGLASSLFQPRQFGLTGADLANISLANTAGLNNMNQFNYATKVQGAQYNNQIAGANASAAAQSQGNMIQGGVSAATSAATIATAFAISCHVAREVYGDIHPKFRQFRFWLMNISPSWFRRLYLTKSLGFAQFIHSRPFIKTITEFIMDMILVVTKPPYVPESA